MMSDTTVPGYGQREPQSSYGSNSPHLRPVRVRACATHQGLRDCLASSRQWKRSNLSCYLYDLRKSSGSCCASCLI